MTDAAQSFETLQDALDRLIEERGGIERFDALQQLAAKAAIRAMGALATGEAAAQPNIERLLAMLPAPLPPPPPQEPFDVDRLSVRDVRELRRIKMIGMGMKPPTSSAFKDRSSRIRDALRLGAALDRVEQRIKSGPRPYHEAPSEAERGELRNLLNLLIGDLHVTAADLFGWPAPGGRAPIDAAAVPIAAPASEAMPGPTPSAANGGPMRRRVSLDELFGTASLPPSVRSGPEYSA